MSFPYNLSTSYTPAYTPGTIIFPDHLNHIGDTDPDAFSSSTDAIYINVIDANGIDRTTELTALTSVGATITLTQNGNSSVYQTTSASFRIGPYPGGESNQAYYDPVYAFPVASTPMILLQAAGENFTTSSPVFVTVNGAPISNEGTRVRIISKVHIKGNFKA